MTPAKPSQSDPVRPSSLLLLVQVARQLQKELDQQLEDIEMSAPLLIALEVACDGEPLVASEVARRCGVTPAAIYSTLRALRLRGLVTTRRIAGGRTSVRVTRNGRDRLHQARGILRDVEGHGFRHLTPEQIEDRWVGLTLLGQQAPPD